MASRFGDTRLSKIKYVAFYLWTNTEHVTAKCTLYATNTYLRGSILLVCFSLRQAFFKVQVVENRKCTEWPQNDIKYWTVKSTFYSIMGTYPKAQLLVRRALWTGVFHIQSCWKWEMYRISHSMHGEWPQDDLKHALSSYIWGTWPCSVQGHLVIIQGICLKMTCNAKRLPVDQN